jgi:hypothetical protein
MNIANTIFSSRLPVKSFDGCLIENGHHCQKGHNASCAASFAISIQKCIFPSVKHSLNRLGAEALETKVPTHSVGTKSVRVACGVYAEDTVKAYALGASPRSLAGLVFSVALALFLL